MDAHLFRLTHAVFIAYSFTRIRFLSSGTHSSSLLKISAKLEIGFYEIAKRTILNYFLYSHISPVLLTLRFVIPSLQPVLTSFKKISSNGTKMNSSRRMRSSSSPAPSWRRLRRRYANHSFSNFIKWLYEVKQMGWGSFIP